MNTQRGFSITLGLILIALISLGVYFYWDKIGSFTATSSSGFKVDSVETYDQTDLKYKKTEKRGPFEGSELTKLSRAEFDKLGSFDECERQGHIVIDSFPRECVVQVVSGDEAPNSRLIDRYVDDVGEYQSFESCKDMGYTTYYRNEQKYAACGNGVLEDMILKGVQKGKGELFVEDVANGYSLSVTDISDRDEVFISSEGIDFNATLSNEPNNKATLSVNAGNGPDKSMIFDMGEDDIGYSGEYYSKDQVTIKKGKLDGKRAILTEGNTIGKDGVTEAHYAYYIVELRKNVSLSIGYSGGKDMHGYEIFNQVINSVKILK